MSKDLEREFIWRQKECRLIYDRALAALGLPDVKNWVRDRARVWAVDQYQSGGKPDYAAFKMLIEKQSRMQFSNRSLSEKERQLLRYMYYENAVLEEGLLGWYITGSSEGKPWSCSAHIIKELVERGLIYIFGKTVCLTEEGIMAAKNFI